MASHDVPVSVNAVTAPATTFECLANVEAQLVMQMLPRIEKLALARTNKRLLSCASAIHGWKGDAPVDIYFEGEQSAWLDYYARQVCVDLLHPLLADQKSPSSYVPIRACIDINVEEFSGTLLSTVAHVTHIRTTNHRTP